MENFIDHPTSQTWGEVYGLYNKVLIVKSKIMKPDKGKQLTQLDHWYQEELPGAIKARKERYVTHEELCKLMKWKLTRGKFRPRLEQMVQSNSEEEVEAASRKAFKELPNLPNAIKALTVLKAIGPATASAVLAAGAPDKAAFMADESMLAIPGLAPLQYTLPFYNEFMDHVKSITKKLNKDQDDGIKWTQHKVELTLWTYQMAKTLCPELLDVKDNSTTAKRKKVSENGKTDDKVKKLKT
ncbi:uncharacterized protein LOC117328725 isoform X2 [Pecten maximus]|uniref:uncharacterized protein LOC117328725 isoform X2 n=1 Tax=Pecten maximus TaxID=6579 RepID=UPI001457E723|nr:uncharacterized protein LOC117328725 isoform X2 [Pecten maximus]